MRFNPQVKSVLLAATAMSLGFAAPAFAQNSDDDAQSSGNDIIVTAQRMEQRLQDVPISITVIDDKAVAANNIVSAKDITTYTPGLVAQGRYGNDNIAFTIRGFSQEQRTTATVGTYFADVVAPRGSGASQGGDGAGPGMLFDLENIQVLKGPQGTLFGRNSTGGAVLLTPKRPTDRLEGYAEANAGSHGLLRGQAVINLPVSDSFRVRVGVDRYKRDGYLKNAGNLGVGQYGKDMANSDYLAMRLSAVADLSPDVENYTVISYVNSHSAPSIPKLVKAYASGAGVAIGTPCSATATSLQCAQVAREASFGDWAVSNSMADTASTLRQWQVSNTTKWVVNDNLTIKNIFAYGEHRSLNNMDLFGGYWLIDGTPFGTEKANQVMTFAYTHGEATSGLSNAQSSLVEELQFQGNAAAGRLIWQAGLYLEKNDPLGRSGVQTAIFTPCADINVFDCRRGGSGPGIAGTGSLSLSATQFLSKAAYAQASYDVTDKLKLTGGIRYTSDKMTSNLNNVTWAITAGGPIFRCTNPTAPGFGTTYSYADRTQICAQRLSNKTSAPTWTLGMDYKPVEDVMLYAKWTRGYRQGGLTIFGADPIQPYRAEKVDTYELGAKTSWRGAIPGNFNISGYYNDFKDQQLQAGVNCDAALTATYKGPCTPTTAIINAGKSRLYGIEAEFGISPFAGFRLNAAYAYLNTKITQIPTAADVLATLPAATVFNAFSLPRIGDGLTFAVPHKATVSASYRLPLPESVGRVTLGGTYVYTAAYRAVTDACRQIAGLCDAGVGVNNGVIPKSSLVNLNINWEHVGGSPIDAAVFVSNVTNERYYTHLNDNLTRGFVSAMLGEPRMYGFRLRYNFGQ